MNAIAAPSRHTRAGFTLPEVLIAVLLMSILSAIALPRWSASLQQQRVIQAANRVAADLTRAQSAAYGSSAPKTVTFTVGTSQYLVSGIAPLHRGTGAYIVVLTDDPYRCTLVSVWGQTGTQTITFNGYGLPDKGGSIIVAAAGIQKTIVVDAATGTAVVQ
ncbi:MAG: prepilin-type N-terminal cleavage/methylation domain-containing protein [Planctomycetaceae bacterium]|nr:prepilin-type N-terminal cleavage/methylation domain-containing protein [Planctomycetaceae bacterium]